MTYLSDVPTVDLDPRVAATVAAGVPGVEQANPYGPIQFTVRLPSTNAPTTFSATQKLAIGAAVAFLLLSGRRRR